MARRVELDVPWARAAEAARAGARYDRARRRWYTFADNPALDGALARFCSAHATRPRAERAQDDVTEWYLANFAAICAAAGVG